MWESHTDAGYDRCGGLNPDLRQAISQVTVNAKPQLAAARSVPLQEDIGHLVPTRGGGSPPRVARSSTDRELLIQRLHNGPFYRSGHMNWSWN